MNDYQQDGPTYRCAQGPERPQLYDPPMELWSHRLGSLTIVGRCVSTGWYARCTCHPHLSATGDTREEALINLRDMAEVAK